MDFLKNLALPQPTEHFHLLLFMLNLVFIVFLPYLGFLVGSSILSLVVNRRGVSSGDPLHTRFARDLIDIAVFSKSGVAFLAIIPALSMVFLLAQLLQSTPAIAAGLMAFGFLTLLAGTILLTWYRYTFRVSGMLSSIGTPGGEGHSRMSPEEIEAFARSNSEGNRRSAPWGITFLIGASILIVGSVSIASNPSHWSDIESVTDLLISPDFLMRYLQFAAVAIGATGIGVLFFFFSWGGGIANPEEPYGKMVRDWGVRLGVISLLLQPLCVVGTVALLPAEALSGVVFGLAGLSLLSFFVSAHFVYAYKKESRGGYVAYAFYALGVALVLLFTKDQVAIRNATKGQAAAVAAVFDRDVEDLQGRIGIVMAAMTGQDIYNAKCSACHLFDQKKVGPPYKDVIPKYAGRKPQLIGFILNPVKMDPAYPNMPNQGLKPSEADSIASFLLAKFTGHAAPPVTPQATVK
jgi:cytochrome c